MPFPRADCGEDCGSAVGEGEFVVAGGDTAPVLHGVERSLDHVTALVFLNVIADGPATAAASASAVACLVGGLGDYRDDAPGAQVRPGGPRRIRLVSHQCPWTGPRSARPAAGHAQMGIKAASTPQ